jgi:hypothetical protein
LTSNAVSAIQRFEARWEAEIVVAALWRQAGGSNDVVSGGDLTFDTPNAASLDDGLRYMFADDAASYLFTDREGKPSALALPEDELRSEVEQRAAQMHVDVRSFDTFSVVGADAIVVGVAKSIDQVDLNINPFGDPGALEGACFVLLDPDGDPLYMWSYSTGLQGGHTADAAMYGGPTTSGSPLPLH